MGTWAVDRCRWLGRPFFLLALALLALNDHVLKQRFPGWWTGKLSDFAGVVVAGTVASVILDRRRGLIVAAFAFATLKVVPGAAAMAAPLLGGPTRQDPTDLLALVALVPLAHWVRPLETPVPDPRSRRSAVPLWRSIRAGAAAVLPVVAAMATVMTATATSCASRPAVAEIDVRGNTFYALVVGAGASSEWARSTDGGQSWRNSPPPPGRAPRPSDEDPYSDATPNGPLQSCTSDGTCFRLREQRNIERQQPDGSWAPELRLTDAAFENISTGCAGAHRGVLESVGASGTGDHPQVVVSLGANGVLARTHEGTWLQRPVRSARTPSDTAIPQNADIAGFVVMLLIGIGLGLYGRRRWPSLKYGVLAFVFGTFASVMILGLVEMSTNADGHEIGITPLAALTTLFVWAATVVVSVVLARRPRPAPPPWQLPPPPAPPPPDPSDVRGDMGG